MKSREELIRQHPEDQETTLVSTTEWLLWEERYELLIWNQERERVVKKVKRREVDQEETKDLEETTKDRKITNLQPYEVLSRESEKRRDMNEETSRLEQVTEIYDHNTLSKVLNYWHRTWRGFEV